jgi:two-component system, sensor histidine kinase
MSTTASHDARRVMVVDDDAVNLILAREVLNTFGVEPVTWNNGAQALTDFESRGFGLILMDVHMPGMSGLQLTDRIRAIERQTGRTRTPIVALTASAMPHELNECLQRDMDAVMSKPFAFESLRDALSRWAIVPVD